MKRILLSIAISCLLVIGYLIVSSVIVVVSDYNMSLLYYIQLPVTLPSFIFFYFSPPTAEDFQGNLTERKLFLTIFSLIVNVLIYAIPVYLFLGIINKFRTSTSKVTEPPPPPTFN